MGEQAAPGRSRREKKIKIAELPRLVGWISLPDAAAKARLTRARMFQLVEDGEFPTAHAIDGSPGTRPALVVIREADFRAYMERRSGAAQKEPEPAQA